jgi:RND superfamily putative drug exporter
MRNLAHWCYRHRRLVVLFWVAALVITVLLAHSAGSRFSNSFTLPKTQSTDAIDLLQKASPNVAGDTEQIVFATTNGEKVTDPSVQADIEAMLAKVAKVPHVTTITSPYTPEGSHQISADGTTAFARVTFDEQSQYILTPLAKQLVNTATSASRPGLTVAVAGQVAEEADRPSFGGVGIGVLFAGLVLLLVFGSLYAMALPLISALASLGTAVSLIELLSHVMKMPQFATQLVLLIGLGVGVDYALFIVTRHRQSLMRGMDTEEAVVTAVNTSGRAVLFAGIIVCIALLGMFALGVTLLYGLAIAAAIGVALTMIAALTLLPAMLGFIGPRRILSKKQRTRLDQGPVVGETVSTGFWLRWANVVQRRPVVPAVLALIVIVVLALPFFSLRLGSADQGNDPVGTTTRTAYDMLANGFGPGFNGPLQLVGEVRTPAQGQALDQLVADIKTQPGVASVAPTILIPAQDGSQTALVEVYPTTSPQSAATVDLIDHLRTSTIPAATSGTGLTIYVGGTTAIFADFASVLGQKLPLFIGLVVVLSFLLLALVFRSLLIPAISAVMNLLSIGAAFGILVAVFQWGWAGSLFGVNRPGPIEAFLPVMLFAILFGLSMDYQVFLVTRIHEEWLKTGDNSLAVRNGLAGTGKTITAAALIMILVFGSFILGGERVIKEFGLGLAAGILVDALIIRMAIVPSVLTLTGRANWWFPGWLDRMLPNVGFEPADAVDQRDQAERGGGAEGRPLDPLPV